GLQEDRLRIESFGDEPGDQVGDVVDDGHRRLCLGDPSGDLREFLRVRTAFRVYDGEAHRVEREARELRGTARPVFRDPADGFLNRFGQHAPSARRTSPGRRSYRGPPARGNLTSIALRP